MGQCYTAPDDDHEECNEREKRKRAEESQELIQTRLKGGFAGSKGCFENLTSEFLEIVVVSGKHPAQFGYTVEILKNLSRTRIRNITVLILSDLVTTAEYLDRSFLFKLSDEEVMIGDLLKDSFQASASVLCEEPCGISVESYSDQDELENIVKMKWEEVKGKKQVSQRSSLHIVSTAGFLENEPNAFLSTFCKKEEIPFSWGQVYGLWGCSFFRTRSTVVYKEPPNTHRSFKVKRVQRSEDDSCWYVFIRRGRSLQNYRFTYSGKVGFVEFFTRDSVSDPVEIQRVYGYGNGSQDEYKDPEDGEVLDVFEIHTDVEELKGENLKEACIRGVSSEENIIQKSIGEAFDNYLLGDTSEYDIFNDGEDDDLFELAPSPLSDDGNFRYREKESYAAYIVLKKLMEEFLGDRYPYQDLEAAFGKFDQVASSINEYRGLCEEGKNRAKILVLSAGMKGFYVGDSFFAGLRAHEIIKAITGQHKPNPLQGLCFHFLDYVRVSLDDVKQGRLFSNKFLEMARRLRLLVVGCGATGNEFVKTLAMMECFCFRDENGILQITDDDMVDIVNSLTQFFFRNKHGKGRLFKVDVVKENVKLICDDMLFDPYYSRMTQENFVLQDEKLEKLDVIMSLVDNRPARFNASILQYILDIPMFTCGAESNQLISASSYLPYKSRVYGMGRYLVTNDADNLHGVGGCTRNFHDPRNQCDIVKLSDDLLHRHFKIFEITFYENGGMKTRELFRQLLTEIAKIVDKNKKGKGEGGDKGDVKKGGSRKKKKLSTKSAVTFVDFKKRYEEFLRIQKSSLDFKKKGGGVELKPWCTVNFCKDVSSHFKFLEIVVAIACDAFSIPPPTPTQIRDFLGVGPMMISSVSVAGAISAANLISYLQGLEILGLEKYNHRMDSEQQILCKDFICEADGMPILLQRGEFEGEAPFISVTIDMGTTWRVLGESFIEKFDFPKECKLGSISIVKIMFINGCYLETDKLTFNSNKMVADYFVDDMDEILLRSERGVDLHLIVNSGAQSGRRVTAKVFLKEEWYLAVMNGKIEKLKMGEESVRLCSTNEVVFRYKRVDRVIRKKSISKNGIKSVPFVVELDRGEKLTLAIPAGKAKRFEKRMFQLLITL